MKRNLLLALILVAVACSYNFGQENRPASLNLLEPAADRLYCVPTPPLTLNLPADGRGGPYQLAVDQGTVYLVDTTTGELFLLSDRHWVKKSDGPWMAPVIATN